MDEIKHEQPVIVEKDAMEQLNLLNTVMSKGVSCEEADVKLLLKMFRDLPPCREAVLECLRGLLLKVLEQYLHRNNNKTDMENQRNNILLDEVEGSLVHLITAESLLWSLTITQWSIGLLGQMGVVIGASGDAILTWSNCPATQLLTRVLNKAIQNLSSEQVNKCFNQLLNLPSRKSPSFELTVAQISASFPKEMVMKMLQSGLEDYYKGFSNKPPQQATSRQSSEREKNLRVDKIASILNHLSHFDHLYLHNSLLTFLQASMQDDKPQAPYTPLLLLHLSSQSPALLKITTNIFFKYVDARVLKSMVTRLQPGPSFKSLTDKLATVLLSCEHMTVQLLDCLLSLSCGDFTALSAGKADEGGSVEESKLEGDIASSCRTLLNMVIIRLQSLSASSSPQMNFIVSLNNHLSDLCLLFRPPFCRQKLLFKVLGHLCHLIPASAPQVLCLVLSHCSTDMDLAIFKELERTVSCKQPLVMYDTLDRVLRMMEEAGDRSEWISRLFRICQLEQGEAFKTQTLGCDVHTILGNFHCRLIRLLHFPPPFTSAPHPLASNNPQTKITVDEKEYKYDNINNNSKNKINNSTNIDNNSTNIDNNTQFSSKTECTSMLHKYNLSLLHLLSLTQPTKSANGMDDLESSSILINLLFAAFSHLKGVEKMEVVKGVVERLQSVCRHGNHQYVISTLLNEALSEGHQVLLNCEPKKPLPTKSVAQSVVPCVSPTFHNLTTTYSDNRPFGLLFHSGTIGNKSNSTVTKSNNSNTVTKSNNNDDDEEQDDLLLNESLFMYALQSCCVPDPQRALDSHKRDGLLDEKVVRSVSACVLQQCMPDGLSHAVAWSEEESIKVNYARDLLVKKEFLSKNLIRKILHVLSNSDTGVWQCSAVLKSLLGHLITFWEACRHDMADSKATQVELQLSISVVDMLNEGGLLPHPLSLVGELMPHVSAYENFLLLLQLWRFIKETNPTPKSTIACESRHSEVVRMVMMNNIQHCGHLFPLFFG